MGIVCEVKGNLQKLCGNSRRSLGNLRVSSWWNFGFIQVVAFQTFQGLSCWFQGLVFFSRSFRVWILDCFGLVSYFRVWFHDFRFSCFFLIQFVVANVWFDVSCFGVILVLGFLDHFRVCSFHCSCIDLGFSVWGIKFEVQGCRDWVLRVLWFGGW